MSETKYLLTIIIIVVTALLCALYLIVWYLMPSGNEILRSLALSVLPNLIAAGIISAAVAIFLERKGILPGELPKQLNEEKLEKIINVLESIQSAKGVVAFYPSFQAAPWAELIGKAQRIDIVVCYFDSWVNLVRVYLADFFRRDGDIRLFLGDPDHDLTFRTVGLRFPDRSESQLREKIGTTYSRLKAIRDEVRRGNVEGHFVQMPPNYSAIIFDGRLLLLSIYEQFRSDHVSSSAILIDIDAFKETREFWSKEIKGFEKAARKIT